MLLGDDADIREFWASFKRQLLAAASTIQYDSATLSASQMDVVVPPEPFSKMQQQLSRCDGGEELDGSFRPHIAVTEAEPLAHVAREAVRAAAGLRPPANSYKQLPLTGCQLGCLPSYRMPGMGDAHAMLDERGAVESRPEHKALCVWSPQDPIWQVEQGTGEITGVWLPAGNGELASSEQLLADARTWQINFARDTRALHVANHMHECTATCVKNVAPDSREVAKNVPRCRFHFYHVLDFTCTDADGEETTKRVRRRGKVLVPIEMLAASDTHGERGRILTQRTHPFISSSSDVAQAAARCNVDVQFTARVVDPDMDVTGVAIPSDDLASSAHTACYGWKVLTPYGRRCVEHLVDAMIAANNTDFYITKYASKQLQSMGRCCACPPYPLDPCLTTRFEFSQAVLQSLPDTCTREACMSRLPSCRHRPKRLG